MLFIDMPPHLGSQHKYRAYQEITFTDPNNWNVEHFYRPLFNAAWLGSDTLPELPARRAPCASSDSHCRA